ncbi:monovalent cation/H(+) antiporter subunit G [Alcanivorax quisquiliarum]|uniref:Monovalent cation/H(+) antiporter subunit G n=1 Tax=Alcanivorax quisquiliarum TaxID=2933565 RepID=A0ABT0E886_9GAMM|nr:monovalent cation/H(+) antiporter subunit G [Alcanivorax quisquiliarum]MCK0538056.1 monovalent cation/H(+) antiporter subunit G [Alcanivorax quisquiliarum]
MSPMEQVPLWLAIPVSALLILGSFLCVTGALGLLRLSNFFQRVHGPSLINTLGAGCMLIASMLFFSVMQSRLVIHELLITLAVLLTAPVTTMMLTRAALARDRRSGRPDVPPRAGEKGGDVHTGDRIE